MHVQAWTSCRHSLKHGTTRRKLPNTAEQYVGIPKIPKTVTEEISMWRTASAVHKPGNYSTRWHIIYSRPLTQGLMWLRAFGRAESPALFTKNSFMHNASKQIGWWLWIPLSPRHGNKDDTAHSRPEGWLDWRHTHTSLGWRRCVKRGDISTS